jgi:hypothetical protein
LRGGVAVAVGVAVLVGVTVGVAVADAVGVALIVAVAVAVLVAVAERVAVAVAVAVAVCVAVAVAMAVLVAVAVDVAVGVAVCDGAANPIPMSLIFWGLFVAVSVKLSRPCLNLPFDGGMNTTETGQSPIAGMGFKHPFPLLARLNPVPVTFTVGAGNSTLLLLMSLTVCGVLCVPAGTLPKLIFFADNSTVTLCRVADGLDCAIASPPREQIAAQAAITTAIARRDEIMGDIYFGVAHRHR